MDNVVLYLDNKIMDLGEKADIKLTYQINDFADISSRNTSYSFKFDLPRTSRNIKFFNQLGNLYDVSNKQNFFIKCDLYRNGIPIVIDGKANITDTDYKKGIYKINILSENFNLKDTLGDKKVSELNFSSLNHILTTTLYWDSLTNDWTDGYIYALCDNGIFDPSNVDIKFQVPMLFYKWVFNEILTSNGFTYSYVGQEDFFNSVEFQDLILSLDRGFNDNDPLIPVEFIGDYDVSYIQTVTSVDNTEFENIDGILFSIVNDPLGVASTASSIYGTETIFRVKENNYYRFNITGNVDGSNSKSVKLVIEINNLEFSVVADDITSNEIINFTQRFYLRTTDEVKIFFIAQSKETGNNTQQVSYIYNLDLVINKDESNKIVNFNSFFTEIKQIDFIKDFAQHFGMLYQIKKGSNNVEFIKIEEFFNDLSNSINWTKKYNNKISEKYEIGDYARRNEIRYNYDEDDIVFANGVISVENATLEPEKTLFTRQWNAPLLSNSTFNNELIWKTKLYEVEFDDSGVVTNVQPSEQKPYIFLINRIITSLTYNLDGGTPITQSGPIPIADFNNITSRQLINSYYLTFRQLLLNQRLIKVDCLLDDLDINNLDFLKLYYFSQEQRYFYINKVSNYQGGKLTEVELIPVPQLEILGDYSDDYSEDYYI